MEGLRQVSAKLSQETRDELGDIVDDAEREFLIYLVVLAAFVLGCAVLTIWYVGCIMNVIYQTQA